MPNWAGKFCLGPLFNKESTKIRAKGSQKGEREPSRTSGSEGPIGNQQGAEQPDEGITDRATALSEVSGATMMGRYMAVGMGFLRSPAPGALVRHLPLSESWDPREVTHPWVCGAENRC